MSFLRRFDPREGIADFWSEFRKPNEYRWPVLLVSIAVTGTMLYAFTRERVVVPPAAPEVTYITSFAPDRTDAEIVEANLEGQARKDAIEAELARREERRKELYRTLGRATGLDVDEMEAEIRAQEEAEATEAETAEPTGADPAAR